MASVTPPQLAIIAAGEMGAAVAGRLARAGCMVYTDLDGRSEATRRRAKEVGMHDAPLDDIVVKADWILSILPPRDAFSLAEKVRDAAARQSRQGGTSPLVFVDCNAVNPETVKQIAGVFAGTGINFIDASIIGGAPKDGFDPTFYASAEPENKHILNSFSALSEYGLKISLLTGEGAGVGDASALKMSYAGITKGTIGIYTTMILAAHASSPATAEALMNELSASQSGTMERMMKVIPGMPRKAYRWVGEMGEIGEFVGGKEGDIYRGLARTYERIEKSLEGDQADVEALLRYLEEAQRAQRK